MGIFDSLLNQAKQALKTDVKKAANNAGQAAANAASRKTETFTFDELPATLDQMKALPEAKLDTPFKSAALTVIALHVYSSYRETGKAMLNWLRGPRPMNPSDFQFINDRFMDGSTYIPISYFEGANPENDYTPNKPYTLKVSAGPYAYQEENYATLDVKSGGADSLRQIKLRKKGDGQWCLWDQFILTGIRQPKSQDPWA